MKARSLLLTPLLALAAGAAEGEDWARLAAETDEPAFALRVHSVEPGSPADEAGLQPGDYVYQIGEAGVRGIRHAPRRGEETVYYCREGGRKTRATLGRDRSGIVWTESLRPQLDYLRGEIGTPDPRWDEAAAEALALLAADPAAAEERWATAKALGYPEDELDAVVRAYAAWKRRRTIPVREAYEAVEREFTVMPQLYAALLEDFAYATGQTDLLKALFEADPGLSGTDPRYFDLWERFDAAPTHRGRLLEHARNARERLLNDELAVPEGEEDERYHGRLATLLEKKSFSPAAGRFSLVKFTMPDDVADFHYSVAFHLYVWSYHERHGSFVRVAARIGEEEGKAIGNRLLAEVELGRDKVLGTYLNHRGAHQMRKRGTLLPHKPIPAEDELEEGAERRMSRAFRIDIIRLGRELAIYVDGVSYCHLPIDPDHPATELHFFSTGISANINDVEVWKLEE